MTPASNTSGVFMAYFILKILLAKSSVAPRVHKYQYVGKIPDHCGIQTSLIHKPYLLLGKLNRTNTHQNKIT
jgi:hypothetical protein